MMSQTLRNPRVLLIYIIKNALNEWLHYTFYGIFCFSDFAAINDIQSHLRIIEHIADDEVRQTDTSFNYLKMMRRF